MKKGLKRGDKGGSFGIERHAPLNVPQSLKRKADETWKNHIPKKQVRESETARKALQKKNSRGIALRPRVDLGFS